MKRKRRTRLLSLFLGLSLALSPAARALTPEQAGDLLDVYYIDDVPEEVLQQSTISGMLVVLGDPYTQYFTPEEYALFSSSMSDTELVGIGISSLITGEGLLIQRVYEDTPAASGGLDQQEHVAPAIQRRVGQQVHHAQVDGDETHHQ